MEKRHGNGERSAGEVSGPKSGAFTLPEKQALAALPPDLLKALEEGVEVLDPRELELPDVGVLQVVDPETGELREISTRSPRLRRRYADAASEQRERIARAIRRAGADHLQLRTDRDWLLDLVRFVAFRRKRNETVPARQP